jgi:hypothetical protein
MYVRKRMSVRDKQGHADVPPPPEAARYRRSAFTMGTIPAKNLAPVAAEKMGHTRMNNGAEKV